VTRTELLEKHRDINVHDDWWQPTYDAFADDMRLKGIRVYRMFFSGFSSQGDGACFEGRGERLGCVPPHRGGHLPCCRRPCQ
jgi:hypothetical protein